MTAHADSDWPPGTGLLLVGHGSRDARGVAEFHSLAERVRRRAAGAPLEACFLEFAQPTISAGFRALVVRGARHVVVMPGLLFAAGHARHDIPAEVAAAAATAPGVVVRQADVLACHARIVALARRRLDEALDPLADTVGPTRLVLVGRGSHDPAAQQEMARFAARLGQDVPWMKPRPAFLAMAEPRIERVLDEVVGSGARRIVVQPHLLFGGLLAARIVDTVVRYAAQFPGIEWVTARPLGPAVAVAEALLDRAWEAAPLVAR